MPTDTDGDPLLFEYIPRRKGGKMISARVTRLFRACRYTRAGEPIRSVWIADDDEAVLVEPNAGKLHAYIRHDGCGKFYPTVVVPLRKAFRLLCCHRGSLASLASFPRLSIELIRIKADSMREAQMQIEDDLQAIAYDCVSRRQE